MAGRHAARLLTGSLGLLAAAAAAQPPEAVPAMELPAAAANRGWLSLGFQSVLTGGSLDAGGDQIPQLAGIRTDTRTLLLALDYQLGRRWSVHASLPYVRKRALDDPGAHDPSALARPQPDSRFLDDGDYHGTWQDWQLGLGYRHALGRTALRYHAVLTYPARDYTFFASAAAGQRLTRLRLGFDASRRIGASNVHLAGGWSYEFVERVLGRNIDKQHLRLSTRWDFAPQWSASVFATARRGNGGVPSDFFRERPLGSELWYQHDRLLRHNYGLAGLGMTWLVSDDWAVSAAASRMVWGDSIHEIRFAGELQLRRGF